MPKSLNALLVLLVACVVALGAALPAGAVEPVRVSAQGIVPITAATEATLRNRGEEAAMREAVFQLALQYVPEDRRSGREDDLRKELNPKAKSLVLTYSAEGTPQRRPTADDPAKQEFVLGAVVTVDGDQLRSLLKDKGWIPSGPPRPSLVVRVTSPTDRGAPPVLDLERYLVKQLGDRGYVVVDPGLSRNSGDAQNAVDLARRVGADVVLDVVVRRDALPPRDASSVGGARAEVSARAVRVSDSSELAVARFEAPGYNADAARAFASALDAARDQVTSSLLGQLDRNLAALQPATGRITLRLFAVTTLLQVELVQKALVEKLGARSVALGLLEPRSAELLVEGPLSSGALQERLTSLVFDGFSLEADAVEANTVSLRVLPSGDAPGRPRPRADRTPRKLTRTAEMGKKNGMLYGNSAAALAALCRAAARDACALPPAAPRELAPTSSSVAGRPARTPSVSAVLRAPARAPSPAS